MIFNNAVCRITKPVVGHDPLVPDEIVVSTTQTVDIRCLLTRLEVTQERNVLGQAASDMWRMRLSTKSGVSPEPGWEMNILSDSETVWHRYVVSRTSTKLFIDVMLRRI